MDTVADCLAGPLGREPAVVVIVSALEPTAGWAALCRMPCTMCGDPDVVQRVVGKLFEGAETHGLCAPYAEALLAKVARAAEAQRLHARDRYTASIRNAGAFALVNAFDSAGAARDAVVDALLHDLCHSDPAQPNPWEALKALFTGDDWHDGGWSVQERLDCARLSLPAAMPRNGSEPGVTMLHDAAVDAVFVCTRASARTPGLFLVDVAPPPGDAFVPPWLAALQCRLPLARTAPLLSCDAVGRTFVFRTLADACAARAHFCLHAFVVSPVYSELAQRVLGPA